jgi:hypothetical protein
MVVSNTMAQSEQPPGTGVLCLHGIVAFVKAEGEVCGWRNSVTEQAVGEIVANLEAYIIANSSAEGGGVPISNAAAFAVTLKALGAEEKAAFCEGRDKERPNLAIDMRHTDWELMRLGTAELTNRPGEPTYGDCF